MSITIPFCFIESVSSDTIFTVIITVSIFIIGQIFLIIYDRYKDKNALSNLSKFFLISVKGIIDPLTTEIADIKDIVTQLEEKRQRSYFLQDTTELNFDFYNKINNSELFNSFTKYLKKKEEVSVIISYTNLIKSIVSFRNYKNEKLKNFDSIINLLNKVTERYSENYIQLMYKIEEIKREKATHSALNDKFIMNVLEAINLANDPKGEMYYQIEKIIDPIISLYRAYGKSPYAQPIMKFVLPCKSAFNYICYIKEMNIKKYKNQIVLLERLNDIILKSVNYLEKHK